MHIHLVYMLEHGEIFAESELLFPPARQRRGGAFLVTFVCWRAATIFSSGFEQRNQSSHLSVSEICVVIALRAKACLSNALTS